MKIQLSDALGKANPVARLKRRRRRKENQAEEGQTVEEERGQRDMGGDVLMLEAWDLSASFPGIEFAVEQLGFPYLSGGGKMDATGSGLSIILGFSLDHGKIDEETGEQRPPTLDTSRVEVEIEDLVLEFDKEGTSYSWLYNLLVTVLNPLIRRYVRSYLEFAVRDNMEGLLEHLNWGFSEAWPYLSAVVDKKPKKEKKRVQVGIEGDVPLGLKGSPRDDSSELDSVHSSDEEWDFKNGDNVKDKDWEKKLEEKGLGRAGVFVTEQPQPESSKAADFLEFQPPARAT